MLIELEAFKQQLSRLIDLNLNLIISDKGETLSWISIKKQHLNG